MKKLSYSLAALLTVALMTVPAHADIVDGPVYQPDSTVPVLVVAVVILAAVVLVWAVLRKRRKK